MTCDVQQSLKTLSADPDLLCSLIATHVGDGETDAGFATVTPTPVIEPTTTETIMNSTFNSAGAAWNAAVSVVKFATGLPWWAYVLILIQLLLMLLRAAASGDEYVLFGLGTYDRFSFGPVQPPRLSPPVKQSAHSISRRSPLFRTSARMPV